MNPKILIVYPIPKEGIEELEKVTDIIYPTGDKPFSKKEILEYIPECDGLLSVFNQEVNGEIIKAGKKLKIIANYGSGYNNVNVKMAARKGIIVCNTPDPVTAPTAELTFSLMLNLMRKTSQFERALRDGCYTEWNMLNNLGSTLDNKTLGIVGLGKIGKSVAFKARAFGMQIHYYQRRRLSGLEEDSWFTTYKRFAQLLKISDVISVHIPLSPQTHHMFGADEFEQMKPTSYFINTSRGSVVDEQALIKALKEKQIAGAALDVFEHEPHISEELLAMENVIAVPHIGTQTIETRIEMGKQASQNLIDYFEGQVPQNRII